MQPIVPNRKAYAEKSDPISLLYIIARQHVNGLGRDRRNPILSVLLEVPLSLLVSYGMVDDCGKAAY